VCPAKREEVRDPPAKMAGLCREEFPVGHDPAVLRRELVVREYLPHPLRIL
jgi:hypothetical protein